MATVAWFYAGGSGGAVDSSANWWANAAHTTAYGSVPSGVDVQIDDFVTTGAITVASCVLRFPSDTPQDISGITFTSLLVTGTSRVSAGSGPTVTLEETGILLGGTWTSVHQLSGNGGADDGGGGGPVVGTWTQEAAVTGGFDAGTVTDAVIHGGKICGGGSNVAVTNLTLNGGLAAISGGGILTAQYITLKMAYSGGAWIPAASIHWPGFYLIQTIAYTGIGIMPSTADVRAGTAVGVSPAVGTLVVPAAATDGQPILLAAEDATVKYLNSCAIGVSVVSSVNGDTEDLDPPFVGVTAEDATESRASPVGNRYVDINIEVITPLDAKVQGGDPMTASARRDLIVAVDQAFRNDSVAALLTTSGTFSVDGVTFLGERQQVSGRRHGYVFAYRLACRLS